MDRRQFFGDSVAGTIIRLVLISIVVGIVFSALGITPFNLVERLEQIVRRITDLASMLSAGHSTTSCSAPSSSSPSGSSSASCAAGADRPA